MASGSVLQWSKTDPELLGPSCWLWSEPIAVPITVPITVPTAAEPPLSPSRCFID